MLGVTKNTSTEQFQNQHRIKMTLVWHLGVKWQYSSSAFLNEEQFTFKRNIQ